MKMPFWGIAICLSVILCACSTTDTRSEMSRSLADAYRLDVRRLDLATGTDGDGVLHGYYAGDSLKILTIRIGLSNYVDVDTFLYEGTSLVGFRREHFSNPESPIAMRDPFSRADYFIRDGRLILLSTSGLEQPAMSIESLQQESDLFRKYADSGDKVVNVEQWIKGGASE